MDKISSPALPPSTGVTLMEMGLWMLLFQWRNPIGDRSPILIQHLVMRSMSEIDQYLLIMALTGTSISIRVEALSHMREAYFLEE